MKATPLEPLVQHQVPARLPHQHLEPVLPSVHEYEPVPRQRVLADDRSRRRRQRVEPFPQVHRLGRHVDPRPCRERQHPQPSIVRTSASSSSGSKPAYTRMRRPLCSSSSSGGGVAGASGRPPWTTRTAWNTGDVDPFSRSRQRNRRTLLTPCCRAKAAALCPLRRHTSSTRSASAARQYRLAISVASAPVVPFCRCLVTRIPHLLSVRRCSQAGSAAATWVGRGDTKRRRGVESSMRSRNFRNSPCRWRGKQLPITE